VLKTVKYKSIIMLPLIDNNLMYNKLWKTQVFVKLTI